MGPGGPGKLIIVQDTADRQTLGRIFELLQADIYTFKARQ
jgi:hypothetical protein